MVRRFSVIGCLVLLGGVVVYSEKGMGGVMRATPANKSQPREEALSEDPALSQDLADPKLKVHKLKIELMTAESFRPFGEVIERPPDARAAEADEAPRERPIRFYPIETIVDGKPVLRVIWQPIEDLRFTQLERHFNVTQSFVPLKGPLSVVAVAAPTDPDDPEDVPRPEDVHAFLIDGTKGWAYKVGTWHSLDRYILSPPGASFLMLNVSPNPSEVVDYDKKFGVIFEVGF